MKNVKKLFGVKSKSSNKSSNKNASKLISTRLSKVFITPPRKGSKKDISSGLTTPTPRTDRSHTSNLQLQMTDILENDPTIELQTQNEKGKDPKASATTKSTKSSNGLQKFLKVLAPKKKKVSVRLTNESSGSVNSSSKSKQSQKRRASNLFGLMKSSSKQPLESELIPLDVTPIIPKETSLTLTRDIFEYEHVACLTALQEMVQTSVKSLGMLTRGLQDERKYWSKGIPPISETHQQGVSLLKQEVLDLNDALYSGMMTTFWLILGSDFFLQNFTLNRSTKALTQKWSLAGVLYKDLWAPIRIPTDFIYSNIDSNLDTELSAIENKWGQIEWLDGWFRRFIHWLSIDIAIQKNSSDVQQLHRIRENGIEAIRIRMAEYMKVREVQLRHLFLQDLRTYYFDVL